MRRLAPVLVLLLAGCSGLGRRTEIHQRLDRLTAEVSKGEYVSVIAALSGQSISELPRFARPRAYLLLGRSLRLSGELGRSLQVFQLAEGLYPKDLNLLTELATVLHRTGLDDRAMPYYRRVLKIHPNNAVSNRGIAEIFRAQGNLRASKSHFERALSEKGWDKNASLWLEYGQVLSEQRDFKKAAAAFEKSVAISETTDSLVALARVKRVLGHSAQSREHIAAAILHNPGREDVLLQRGLWELEDNDLDAAFSTAQLVLSGDKDHALARWLRASVYLRSDKREQASADLVVAATAGRKDPFVAKTARAMLKRLIGNP